MQILELYGFYLDITHNIITSFIIIPQNAKNVKTKEEPL